MKCMSMKKSIRMKKNYRNEKHKNEKYTNEKCTNKTKNIQMKCMRKKIYE